MTADNRTFLSESGPAQGPRGQCYDEEEFLVQSVTQFVVGGLEAGERVLIIATPPHRRAVFDQLQRKRLTFSRGFAVSNYIEVDAAAALSNFMVNGRADPARFRKLIGGYLEADSLHTTRIRAYAEMFALLWEQGKSEAAVELERLWNNLAEQYSISLFRAYPISAVRDQEPVRTQMSHR